MLNCLVIVEHYLDRVDPGNHLFHMALRHLLQIIAKYKITKKVMHLQQGRGIHVCHIFPIQPLRLSQRCIC